MKGFIDLGSADLSLILYSYVAACVVNDNKAAHLKASTGWQMMMLGSYFAVNRVSIITLDEDT